jgi:hypothetical protein
MIKYISELLKENVISQEVADTITNYYLSKKKVGSYVKAHNHKISFEKNTLIDQEVEIKASFVKDQIKKDFFTLYESDFEGFFEKFKDDKRTLSFLKFYNKTVLDKEKIDFGEFKRQWAIQGMTRKVYNSFNENYFKIKEEIQKERDIRKFFENNCCSVRREASFCSKLFHTVLPDEFPPVDNPIRRKFHLQNEEFIKCVLIIKLAYKLFIIENPDKLKLIRQLLSKPRFAYLRVKELSDIRILDMYYWFKESRE